MVPLTRAVEMTFSGQYPCALCKAIAEKQQSQDLKTMVAFKQAKKLLSSVLSVKERPADVAPRSYEFREPLFESITEAPPTPPPRLV